jgi:hypothetical protein
MGEENLRGVSFGDVHACVTISHERGKPDRKRRKIACGHDSGPGHSQSLTKGQSMVDGSRGERSGIAIF